jgi:hypothetical protein
LQLEHPLISRLQGHANQWLADIIFAFNTGNISRWKELQSAHGDKLNAIPGMNPRSDGRS